MGNLVGGWQNGSLPGFLSDLGERGKYRRDVEFENVRHANAKDLEAHRAQLSHENRIREIGLEHEHISAREAAARSHEASMERMRGRNSTAQRTQDHANAMDMETHRAQTTTNMLQNLGGGAPVRQFSMGNVNVTFGAGKKAAAKPKTPSRARAPKSPSA